jgi:hypothetical protein
MVCLYQNVSGCWGCWLLWVLRDQQVGFGRTMLCRTVVCLIFACSRASLCPSKACLDGDPVQHMCMPTLLSNGLQTHCWVCQLSAEVVVGLGCGLKGGSLVRWFVYLVGCSFELSRLVPCLIATRFRACLNTQCDGMSHFRGSVSGTRSHLL